VRFGFGNHRRVELIVRLHFSGEFNGKTGYASLQSNERGSRIRFRGPFLFVPTGL
jgi:hypothetical protein